ncbi:hypothetical protein OIO90_002585 [Microbotryomycetes sp. JL221]|nr:hypothetical protein OIO90_002585 [Microbotryomycetes sp. JL221]
MSSPEPPDLPPPLPRLPRSLSDVSSSPDDFSDQGTPSIEFANDARGISNKFDDDDILSTQLTSSIAMTGAGTAATKRSRDQLTRESMNSTPTNRSGYSLSSTLSSTNSNKVQRSPSPSMITRVGLQSASEYAFARQQQHQHQRQHFRAMDNVGLGLGTIDQLPSPSATVSDQTSTSGNVRLTNGLTQLVTSASTNFDSDSRSPEQGMKPSRPPKSEARMGLLTPTKLNMGSSESGQGLVSPTVSDLPIESDIASMSMERDEGTPSPELLREVTRTSFPSVSVARNLATSPHTTRSDRRRTMDFDLLAGRGSSTSPSPSKRELDAQARYDQVAVSPTHSRTASDFTPRGNRTYTRTNTLGSLREDGSITETVSPSRSRFINEDLPERSQTSMSNYSSGGHRSSYIRRSDFVGSERTRAASVLGDYTDRERGGLSPVTARLYANGDELSSSSPRVRRRTSITGLIDRGQPNLPDSPATTNLTGSGSGSGAGSHNRRARPNLPNEFRQSPNGQYMTSKSPAINAVTSQALESRVDEILASRRKTIDNAMTPVRAESRLGRRSESRLTYRESIEESRDIFRDTPSRLARYRAEQAASPHSVDRELRSLRGLRELDLDESIRTPDHSFNSSQSVNRKSFGARDTTKFSPSPSSIIHRSSTMEDRYRSNSRMSFRPVSSEMDSDHHRLLLSAFQNFEKHFNSDLNCFSICQELIQRMSLLVSLTSKLNNGLHDLDIQTRQQDLSTNQTLDKQVGSLLRISNDQIRTLTEDLIAFTRLDRERTQMKQDSDGLTRSASRLATSSPLRSKPNKNVVNTPLSPNRTTLSTESTPVMPPVEQPTQFIISNNLESKGSDASSISTFNSFNSSIQNSGSDESVRKKPVVASPKYGPVVLSSPSGSTIGHNKSPLSRATPTLEKQKDQSNRYVKHDEMDPHSTKSTTLEQRSVPLRSSMVTEPSTRPTTQSISRRTSTATHSDQTNTTSSPRSFYSAFEKYEARRNSSQQTDNEGNERRVSMSPSNSSGPEAVTTTRSTTRSFVSPSYGSTMTTQSSSPSSSTSPRYSQQRLKQHEDQRGQTVMTSYDMQRHDSRASTASTMSTRSSIVSGASDDVGTRRAERLKAVGDILRTRGVA